MSLPLSGLPLCEERHIAVPNTLVSRLHSHLAQKCAPVAKLVRLAHDARSYNVVVATEYIDFSQRSNALEAAMLRYYIAYLYRGKPCGAHDNAKSIQEARLLAPEGRQLYGADLSIIVSVDDDGNEEIVEQTSTNPIF